MLLIDVNVWIRATHKDAVDHVRYFQWLAGIYSAMEPFAVTDLIAAGYLRIITNPKAFVVPFTMDQAILAWDDITSRSTCKWVHPGKDHWGLFRKLCASSGVFGNLVNDAWLAALAIENDCELVSDDKDFGKFPGLRWQRP